MTEQMPLFPLNTVLFPGMPLSLHIFEDRYKLMINTCIAEKIPFGVVLISDGAEAMGPLATPYMMGCSARITQVQPLGQGRMNLVAVGEERFRIHELDQNSQPYLVGHVETTPLTRSGSEALKEAGDRLRPMVTKYLQVLASAGDVQFDPEQVPSEALTLANFSAFLLRVEADEKQKLLEVTTEVNFVKKVRSLFVRENALLDTMIAQSEREKTDGNPGPFSLN